MEFTAEKCAEFVENAKTKLIELYDIKDNFHSAVSKEKQEKLMELIKNINSYLDSAGDNDSGEICLLKGKAYNALEVYTNEAEDLLSKAAKRNPTNAEVWLQLGICFWKKNDRSQALTCLNESIIQKESKEALREMSVLTRQIKRKDSSPESSSSESIKLAKRAIGIDMNDAKSWYVLGNAYYTKFFGLSNNMNDLKLAMNAYKLSLEKGGDSNPDLYYHRGNIARYLQDFDLAISSFNRAYYLDPGHEAAASAVVEVTEFINKIDGLVTQCKNALTAKEGSSNRNNNNMNTTNSIKIKRKRVLQMIESLNSITGKNKGAHTALSTLAEAGTSHVSICSLQSGHNEKVVISLRVVLCISQGSMPPESFLCVDSTGKLCMLSVYQVGVAGSAQFASESIITVVEPILLENSSEGENKENSADESIDYYDDDVLGNKGSSIKSFSSIGIPVIQVTDLATLAFDGRMINKASIAAPSIRIETSDT